MQKCGSRCPKVLRHRAEACQNHSYDPASECMRHNSPNQRDRYDFEPRACSSRTSHKRNKQSSFRTYTCAQSERYEDACKSPTRSDKARSQYSSRYSDNCHTDSSTSHDDIFEEAKSGSSVKSCKSSKRRSCSTGSSSRPSSKQKKSSCSRSRSSSSCSIPTPDECEDNQSENKCTHKGSIECIQTQQIYNGRSVLVRRNISECSIIEDLGPLIKNCSQRHKMACPSRSDNSGSFSTKVVIESLEICDTSAKSQNSKCEPNCPKEVARRKKMEFLERRQREFDEHILHSGLGYFDGFCTCSFNCIVRNLYRDPFVRNTFRSLLLFAIGIKLCFELDGWTVPARSI